MDVVDMWAGRVPTYNDDTLVCNNRYEHIVANPLGLASGAMDVRVLIRKKTTSRQRSQEYQILSDAALYAPFDEIGNNPQAV